MRVKEIRAGKMSRKLPALRVSSVDVAVGPIIGAGDRGSRGVGNGALHPPMASILTKALLGDHCQTHRIEEETGHTQGPGPATPRSLDSTGLAWCNTWAGEGETFAVPCQRDGSPAAPHPPAPPRGRSQCPCDISGGARAAVHVHWPKCPLLLVEAMELPEAPAPVDPRPPGPPSGLVKCGLHLAHLCHSHRAVREIQP